MATKADKKNAIRQDIIDSAAIYSQSLAGKAFLSLYIWGRLIFTFQLLNMMICQLR